ncbi:alpha/beta hydrolase-fold protein [Seonamhaeicola sp.]|uniref:carboxylesterase family protein n=1 Tax=Seonamhaeicola sp. TaxID=1912245 RepID=UPI002628FDBD|nr:alpha/beta hydrolase-fold protein [Seonamhaeicola sp.]
MKYRILKHISRRLCFLIVGAFLLMQPTVFAQQRTGNIVEYFGKEKIDDIKEGKLLHIFKTGLALKVPSLNFSSFPKDPVFNKFLTVPSYRPVSEAVFDIDISGTELRWKTISTDTTNSFNEPHLRSSYVYLNYRSAVSRTVLFEASGHSVALINGQPHEGDYYDYGWNLIPVRLQKGNNTFLLKVGRFPRIRARLIIPDARVQLTERDMTTPDILAETRQDYMGAVRLINSTDSWVKGHRIHTQWAGGSRITEVPAVPPMSVRKIRFDVADAPAEEDLGAKALTLQLKNKNRPVGKQIAINLQLRSRFKHHKRTFISDIDGSVQYYSVAPNSNEESKNAALFLSVHGASVEAVNQANAYKQKDWGTLVAPTNRRPFGFAWEDWGRLDALEVLGNAKTMFKPDPKKIYLTGHSMGGHGSWYLGATYPDHFAAIAPCAGYPDLLAYRDYFVSKRLSMSQRELSAMGISPQMVAAFMRKSEPSAVERIIKRAGTPSRTLKLIRNYLHLGIYVLHGEKDDIVPTSIARDMRQHLGEFHPDFTYYEYPDGTHWYGDHSVDWNPIFDFFKQREIPEDKAVKTIEFSTGSPGVSSGSHFVKILQQKRPFQVSSFTFNRDPLELQTQNVATLKLDRQTINDSVSEIVIDGGKLPLPKADTVVFKNIDGAWQLADEPELSEKGPHRSGGFKDAFRNHMVFVYATRGTKTENDWYYNRARFDAEKFWYRANGSVELVRDIEFSLDKYPDRNVILYGNSDNNAAWNKLLNKSPIQVKNNEVNFDGKKLYGEMWGMYFITARKDSDTASIGVVTATGAKGMKAAYMNHYLVNGTTFPDVVLFDDTILSHGVSGIKCAGFFGNDWSVANGEFEWK